MKRQIDVPFEQPMQFFTPDLYLRFNSSNDEVADRANDEWDKAVAAYEKHLAHIRDRLPVQARALAEICLHDCDLLGWDEATQPDLRRTAEAFPIWSAFSVLSVRRDNEVLSLSYVLWDKVRRAPAPPEWPFSKARPHWLYDEIDVAAGEPGKFLQRIMFSDGTIAEIPFAIVFFHAVPLERANGDTNKEAAGAGTTTDNR